MKIRIYRPKTPIPVFLVILAAITVPPLAWAQYGTDPGAVQDAEMERRKILRAADQIETMTSQFERLQQEMESLKQDLAALRNENQQLRQALSQAEAQRAKERDVLLAEISKQVARPSVPQPVTPDPAPRPATQEGYEYEVRKGDTLWLIAKAYSDAGLKVTVQDIREANHLKNTDTLRVGQKLFIPHKK
jgi:nucleoid-associated protein YgaU